MLPHSATHETACRESWAADLKLAVRSADDLPSIGPFLTYHKILLQDVAHTLAPNGQFATPHTILANGSGVELRGVSFVISTYPGTSHALMDVTNLYVAMQVVRIDSILLTHPWTRGDAGVGAWLDFLKPLLQAMLHGQDKPPVILGADAVSGDLQLDIAVRVSYPTKGGREPWFSGRPATCFRDVVYAGLGLTRGVGLLPRGLLYIKRSHARTIANEGDVEQLLLDFSAAHQLVFSAHFTGAGAPASNGAAAPVALTLKQQVEMAGGASVFVGMHGAGLWLCAVAPRGAVLLEMQPPGKYWDFYRQLCEVTGGVRVEVIRLASSACTVWGTATRGSGERCDSANVDLDVLRSALYAAVQLTENHRNGVMSE